MRVDTYGDRMNLAGRPWHAARQLVTHRTHPAGLAAAPLRVALGALSRTVATVVRPAGVRGIAVETTISSAT